MLLLAFMAAAAFAQDVTGSWNGTLNAGGMELRVVFNFTKGGDGKTACTLDSPDQGVRGIPVEVVSASQDSVSLTVKAIGAAYEGRVIDGEIKGTFSQMGHSFPLSLKPGMAEVNRPQEPEPPFPYATEEVIMSGGSSGCTLSGTLTYPVGYEKMDKGSVPVVVMVTGSGPQNRDEELMGHKPFLVIADHLARHGIASLRYDDRGVGKSTGDFATATSEDNMSDARAAVDFARKTGKFGKAGVLGHSEGGVIAFMLAARKVPDFIVTLAAPGVRGDSILILQHDVSLKYSGMSDDKIKDFNVGLRALYDAVREGKTAAEVKEATALLEQKTGVKLTDDLLNTVNTPWMKCFLSLDPADDIRHAVCPVMALNGTSDLQVNCEVNLGTIRRLLPENKQNLIKEYPRLNHLFQHCLTGNITEYAKIEETVSPEVLKDIVEWIRDL